MFSDLGHDRIPDPFDEPQGDGCAIAATLFDGFNKTAKLEIAEVLGVFDTPEQAAERDRKCGDRFERMGRLVAIRRERRLLKTILGLP